MNDGWSEIAANSICHAADMVKVTWQEAGWEQMRPSILFKPALLKDGDMWCALLGDNLQDGVAGFGETPAKAMWAFDTAFNTPAGSHIIAPTAPTETNGDGE